MKSNLWFARSCIGFALYCLLAAATQAAPGPLVESILAEDLEGVRAALDAGHSPNAPDPEMQRPPLHIAVSPGVRGLAGIVELLVSKGADINAEDPKTRLTPLMAASITIENTGPFAVIERQNAAVLVERLLKLGADPDRATAAGETPLLVAVNAGNANIARLLLGRHANPDLADAKGRTPLMHAALRKRTDIVTVLLDSGANARATDPSGTTALMHAAGNNDVAMVKLLLSRATPPAVTYVNMQNARKASALHIAHAVNSSPEIVSALLAAGADAGLRDARGNNPQGVQARSAEAAKADVLENQEAARADSEDKSNMSRWLIGGLVVAAAVVAAALVANNRKKDAASSAAPAPAVTAEAPPRTKPPIKVAPPPYVPPAPPQAKADVKACTVLTAMDRTKITAEYFEGSVADPCARSFDYQKAVAVRTSCSEPIVVFVESYIGAFDGDGTQRRGNLGQIVNPGREKRVCGDVRAMCYLSDQSDGSRCVRPQGFSGVRIFTP